MKKAAPSQRADIVIGGAGFAGLALAIALRQALGDGFTITVADPALAQVNMQWRRVERYWAEQIRYIY